MKTIFALLLSIGAALAVTVSWEHEAPGVTTFRVYQSADAALPVNQWQVVATTTNLSAQLDLLPGAYFFTVSASNFWGEVFSVEVVSTPGRPKSVTKQQIKRD